MSSIFPFIQPELYADIAVELPEYTDIAWDYEHDKPRFMRGEPVVVSRLPAVMSWAWRALKVQRFLNEIYSYDYGNEMMSLVGQQWIADTKIAEASRYVRECLTQLPYITNVTDIDITFSETTVTVKCTVVTVYGSDRLEASYV